MRRIIFFALIVIQLSSFTVRQTTNDVRKKLSDFFFGLSLNAGIPAMKELLKSNPEFNLHSDPNRDPNRSITGSFSANKNLNPMSTRNQLVISTAPVGTKKEMMSINWYIDYKLEDLATAINDYEKFKTMFKPYFEEVSTKEEIGYHQEEVESIYLKDGSLEVVIKMMKSNNFSHTIEVECKDVRKKK